MLILRLLEVVPCYPRTYHQKDCEDTEDAYEGLLGWAGFSLTVLVSAGKQRGEEVMILTQWLLG